MQRQWYQSGLSLECQAYTSLVTSKVSENHCHHPYSILESHMRKNSKHRSANITQPCSYSFFTRFQRYVLDSFMTKPQMNTRVYDISLRSMSPAILPVRLRNMVRNQKRGPALNCWTSGEVEF